MVSSQMEACVSYLDLLHKEKASKENSRNKKKIGPFTVKAPSKFKDCLEELMKGEDREVRHCQITKEHKNLPIANRGRIQCHPT